MEVAVVGAGPAGALGAERLARAGHRVTLFDPSQPREKPCGGGVTPGAFARHPELRSLCHLGRPVRHVQLRSPSGALLRVEIPSPIVVFPRKDLDAGLAERAVAAGAKLRRERVRHVALHADGVEVSVGQARERFDFVVGADGAASVVRRRLLGERPGGPASYATAGFHVSGFPEDDLYVEFLPDMRGYLWVFPRPDHASVGIAAPVGRIGGAGLRARVLEMLERRYPASLSLPRTPYAASIPCAEGRRARRPILGGARFALIGDAANLGDAITGEGIAHALDSAGLLADALHRCGPLGAAREYRDRWMQGPGRELAIAARWTARYYRPPIVRAVLRLARTRSWARTVMSDLLAMQQPYSSLKRRALRELTLGRREASQRLPV